MLTPWVSNHNSAIYWSLFSPQGAFSNNCIILIYYFSKSISAWTIFSYCCIVVSKTNFRRLERWFLGLEQTYFNSEYSIEIQAPMPKTECLQAPLTRSRSSMKFPKSGHQSTHVLTWSHTNEKQVEWEKTEEGDEEQKNNFMFPHYSPIRGLCCTVISFNSERSIYLLSLCLYLQGKHSFQQCEWQEKISLKCVKSHLLARMDAEDWKLDGQVFFVLNTVNCLRIKEKYLRKRGGCLNLLMTSWINYWKL